MAKDIICLDFDGVVHSYASGWKGADTIPDPPMPGAIEAIRLYTQHFQVAIFSSRSNQSGGISAMQDWMGHWAGLEFPREAFHELVKYPVVKPPAKVTLDDRGMQFTGEWPSVAELKNFKPFYLLNRKKKGR